MMFGWVRPLIALAVPLWIGACGGDGTPRDLDVTITTARVSARTDQPDALAELDVTAELEATVDLSGVEVTEVTVQQLPDGAVIDFDVNVRGPQDASSFDLPGGEVVVARITNTSVTNAALMPLCGAAASVTIVVEAEEFERTASRDVTVSCS